MMKIESLAKFKEWSKKCQGTTLVVPQTADKEGWALAPAVIGFVICNSAKANLQVARLIRLF
jgi:hypothetical protein